jgi:hypothetical protein
MVYFEKKPCSSSYHMIGILRAWRQGNKLWCSFSEGYEWLSGTMRGGDRAKAGVSDQ